MAERKGGVRLREERQLCSHSMESELTQWKDNAEFAGTVPTHGRHSVGKAVGTAKAQNAVCLRGSRLCSRTFEKLLEGLLILPF